MDSREEEEGKKIPEGKRGEEENLCEKGIFKMGGMGEPKGEGEE